MTALPVLLALSLAAGDAHLTVLAAASLKAPLEQAAAAFEREHPGAKVEVSAAATGVLARQVEHGAPADVFIGAAREQAEALAARGLLLAPREIARNRLVVAVPAGAKARPASLADLAGPAFRRIGLGQPASVPAGAYALQALTRQGLDAKLRERFVFGESVTQVLAWLRGGDLEAGFVYATDARSAAGKVEVAFTVDEALHDPVVYPAAVVAASKRQELARAFVAYLAGPGGQAVLAGAGFLPPGDGLEVQGALPRTGRLSRAELEALGPVSARWRDHDGEHQVVGAPLDKVLAHFGFEPGPMGRGTPVAEKRPGWKLAVLATAADGYQAAFSCAELEGALGGTRALVAWSVDGQPLPEGKGPLRLVVVTDREPERSVFALRRLEVIDLRKAGH